MGLSTKFCSQNEQKPANALSTDSVLIQFNHLSHEISEREIDLVLSILDDIVQEIQRQDAEIPHSHQR